MELNKSYWDGRYIDGTSDWDIGAATPPLKEYIAQLENKALSILIPGCGSGYEAEVLIQNGFTNVSLLDFAESITTPLKQKFANYPTVKIYTGDFFAHTGQYDIVLEQTFFCALNPELRKEYYKKMYSLLKPNGKIAGVMFGVEMSNDSPPFGGSADEYKGLMAEYFTVKTIEPCYNSIPRRQGKELFVILERK